MTYETATARPVWLRVMLAVPVLGWIARDLLFGAKDNIYYLLVALLSLWGIAILTWGVPALYLPALASVPVMMLVLLWITRG